MALVIAHATLLDLAYRTRKTNGYLECMHVAWRGYGVAARPPVSGHVRHASRSRCECDRVMLAGRGHGARWSIGYSLYDPSVRSVGKYRSSHGKFFVRFILDLHLVPRNYY